MPQIKELAVVRGGTVTGVGVGEDCSVSCCDIQDITETTKRQAELSSPEVEKPSL